MTSSRRRQITIPILATILTTLIAGPLWHWQTVYSHQPFSYYLQQQWDWFVNTTR